MKIRGFAVVLAVMAVAGCLVPARGQQAEKMAINPPLSQVFPLDLKPDGVRLKYPVLLNERTILGPDVLLRFIYDDPNAGVRSRGGGSGDDNGSGGGLGGGRHHQGGGGGWGGGSSGGGDGDESQAYTRSAGGSSDGRGDSGLSDGAADANKEAKSEIQTEVWTSVEPFHEALDEAADMGTTVVYTSPGKPKPLSTTFDLPDGMLLAEVDGHVRVLALTDDSEAGAAGLQPGDEIRSLNGGAALVSLRDFLRTFITVRQTARQGNQPYAMQVWRSGESKMITLQVGAPPSLPSMFHP